MISSMFFIDKLGKDYLGSTRISSPGFFPTRAEIISDQKMLSKDLSYFCSAKDIKEFFPQECEDSTVVFICDCEKNTVPDIPPHCLGLLLSCTVAKALNLLAEYARDEEKMLADLNKLIATGGNAHQFISRIAEMTGGDTLLLDDSYRIIFTSEMHVGGLLQNSLSSSGQIPETLAKNLVFNPNRYRDNVGITIDRTYNTAIFTTSAISPSRISTTMFLEIPNNKGQDILTLMNHAQRLLTEWMLSGAFANAARIQTSFQSVWDKIKIGDTLNNSEMVNVLENLPHPIKGKICVAAICFDSYDNIPYNYFLARLRNLDRDVNVAVENKDIIMVLPKRLATPGIKSPSLENNQGLNELLKDFNAYMMYGNYTGRPRHIRDVYYLTKKTLVIARKIDDVSDNRIFFYEDFASYAAIDIAAQSYLKEDIQQDAYMLVNPTVLDLSLYDRTHGDNLADLLFFYLTNERNLKKTADDMHMHRNTVLNKLKKINSLVSIDYEDFRLRQRLIFSSQFIRYYEKVLKMPLPIKSNHDV